MLGSHPPVKAPRKHISTNSDNHHQTNNKIKEKKKKTYLQVIWYLDTGIFSQIAPLMNDNHKNFLPEQDCNHAHVVVLNQNYF